MTDVLPNGWATARLEEVVTKQKGKKPAVLSNTPAPGFVPYLDIRAIEKKEIREFAELKSSRIASERDLFVVWDGARSGWVGGGITGAIGSTIMSLTPQQVDSNYLRQFLATQFTKLNTNPRGTGIPHVDPEVFWNLEVPLAPLAEQRRIVAKLENLLAKVDACQERLEKIPSLLKRFRQSILAAACSGRLTADWREEHPTEVISEATRIVLHEPDYELNAEVFEAPDTWVWTKLQRVCLKITDGEHLTPPLAENGVPLLSAKDVREYHLDFTDTKFVTTEFAAKSRTRCNPEQGDILVVSRGATIGRTCRVKVQDVFCLMGSVLLFKPDTRYIVPQLLEFCFKSPSGLAALIATSSSTAQQAIYIKDMRSFVLPIPPLAEQQEIVRRVENLFALADKLESGFTQARAQVDKLTPSLLSRAFAGKLVPQDPNDEPASELLKRIKASQQ